MTKNYRLLPAMALALLVTFTACKKDKEEPTDNSDQQITHAEDQRVVSKQFDDLAKEAGLAMESSAAYSGRMQNPPVVICDASVSFDSTSNPRTITIAYNGTTACHAGWSRTGTVVLSMPQGVQWKDAGASITATYQDVKLTRIADNKSITINGIHTITNESGGLLFNLPNLQHVIHTVSSNGMSIKFDDNTTRTWQVGRQHTYTYNNGAVATITGTHTSGNLTGIAEWGINRFGQSFTTAISQPLVVRQDCSFRLTSGELTHNGLATTVVKFGLDANGNPTSCPGNGSYYLKLTWSGPNGNTYSTILPY